MEVVKGLFDRLGKEEDKLQVLLDGKAHLVNINEAALKEYISAQDLKIVFDCLETDDEDQISAAAFILKLLLPVLDVSPKLEVLSDCLKDGVDHSFQEVRRMCMKELQECSVTDVGNQMFMNNIDLMSRIIELIGEESMTIPLMSCELLANFACYSLPAAKSLLTGSHLAKLKSVMEIGDTFRYRVYDVVVKIQSKSEQLLAICIQSNIVQQLVSELRGSDILVLVNCISTLSTMASTKHSLHFLKQSRAVETLVEMVTTSASNPLSRLYMPEIVKFFGKVSYQDGVQSIVEVFPQFLPILFSLLESEDPVNKKIAIETIGFIGSTVDGKNALEKYGSQSLPAVKEICSVLRSDGNVLRLFAVNAMSQLLHVEREKQTEDVLDITLKWFECIGSDPVDRIIGLCKQPFKEVKCAGFHLISTLAEMEWGMSAMVEFPTFTEFLLDRSADGDKESKDARYAAVKSLADSPYCKHVFGNNNWLKFRTYVKEGPIYAESVPSVSVEEA